MDPFTIMAILGTINAGTSIAAGQMQAEANEEQAIESERVGREKSKVAEEKASQLRSTQKAGFAKSGFDIRYGSPQQIMLETWQILYGNKKQFWQGQDLKPELIVREQRLLESLRLVKRWARVCVLPVQ